MDHVKERALRSLAVTPIALSPGVSPDFPDSVAATSFQVTQRVLRQEEAARGYPPLTLMDRSLSPGPTKRVAEKAAPETAKFFKLSTPPAVDLSEPEEVRILRHRVDVLA